MTRVFLSWSGTRSQAMATVLHRWLPRVMQSVRPWMSTDDILKGRRWSAEIGRNLQKHRVGIICVTPENYLAPWMLFEAGALSRSLKSGKVIPLLLGITASDLTGPLSEFQASAVDRDDFLRLLHSLNEESETPLTDEVLKDVLDKFWPELESTFESIAAQRIPGDSASVRNVVKAFANYGLGKPAIGDQAFFESGFESHALYSTLTDVMTQRLWICGRKNRKLFDKEHRDLFSSLKTRVAGGFDFRVLFLNPDSPTAVLRAAHRDENFVDQLRTCITNARQMLGVLGIDAANHCRMYNVHRTISYAIVDDAVLYAPIALDETGCAKPLTRAPFAVMNASAPLGSEIAASFVALWNVAAPLS